MGHNDYFDIPSSPLAKMNQKDYNQTRIIIFQKVPKHNLRFGLQVADCTFQVLHL